MNWRPTATRRDLEHRAAMLAGAREFFAQRGLLEVETPILSAAAVSDPQIESLCTEVSGLSGALAANSSRFYLNSSPEYAMKRLLAAGSGDIYQICKVFRDGEHGRWHNPEFTLIEWYRLGMDDEALITEVEALLVHLLSPYRRVEPAIRLRYADAFQQHAGIDPHRAGGEELDRAIAAQGVDCRAELDRDAKLDLLMGLVIGPRLGRERPCFLTDYPASQAALARLKTGTPTVAARFELYLDGLELANGFHELVNANDQRRRFRQDLAARAARAQVQTPLDERLLAALDAGMPDCAGVALGFDRLIALALGKPRLAEVMAFDIENA